MGKKENKAGDKKECVGAALEILLLPATTFFGTGKVGRWG